MRADVVEEGAVVADDEHGAAEAREAALEPGDGVEVEVVGGLVEEEQVGLLREDDAEVEPARARRPRGARAAARGRRREKPRCWAIMVTRRSSSSPPCEVVLVHGGRQAGERRVGAAGGGVLGVGRGRAGAARTSAKPPRKASRTVPSAQELVRLAGVGDPRPRAGRPRCPRPARARGRRGGAASTSRRRWARPATRARPPARENVTPWKSWLAP